MFPDQYHGIKRGTDPKIEVYRKEIQCYIYFFFSMNKHSHIFISSYQGYCDFFFYNYVTSISQFDIFNTVRPWIIRLVT